MSQIIGAKDTTKVLEEEFTEAPVIIEVLHQMTSGAQTGSTKNREANSAVSKKLKKIEKKLEKFSKQVKNLCSNNS